MKQENSWWSTLVIFAEKDGTATIDSGTKGKILLVKVCNFGNKKVDQTFVITVHLRNRQTESTIIVQTI